MTAARIRRVSREVIERMAALMPWHFSSYDQFGISYQTCRFCRQGSEAHEGLWKYGVRHYVCTQCRDAITNGGKV